jgi:hypothetical protein
MLNHIEYGAKVLLDLCICLPECVPYEYYTSLYGRPQGLYTYSCTAVPRY